MPFDPSKPFEVVPEAETSGFDPSRPFETVDEEKFGKTINADIERIAKKYKIDPGTLENHQMLMGSYDPVASTDDNWGTSTLKGTAANIASNVSEGIGGGAGAWLAKKFSDDNTEAALDELRRAVDHHKPAEQVARETLLSVVPGTVAAKGMGLAGKAAIGIAESSRAGVMESDSGEELEGAAMGGGIGAVAEAATAAIPVIGKPLSKAAKWAGKKTGRVLAGVPESAVDRYLANPAAVNKAENLKSITDEFIETVDDVKDDLSSKSGESYTILQNSGSLDAPDAFTVPLHQEIDRITDLGLVGEQRKGIVKYLNGIVEDVWNMTEPGLGTVGMEKGKTILGVLDAKISKLKKKGGDSQVLQSLYNARKGIDNFLKDRVPEYKDHMEELAKQTKDVVGIANDMKSPQGAYETLKRIMQSRSPYKKDALERFDKQFGTSFTEKLKDSYAKDAFVKESTQGSRKTLGGSVVGGVVGTAVGGPLGGLFGGLAGNLAGMTADKYGGLIYKSILDGGLKLGKYTEALKRIYEKRGAASVAAAHVALMKSDAEYRKMVEQQQEQPK